MSALIMFVAGIMVYEAVSANVLRFRLPRGVELAIAILAAGAVVSIPALPRGTPEAVPALMLFVAFGLVGACSLADEGGLLATAFSFMPLRCLGNMSYSYYLVHAVGVHLTAVRWFARSPSRLCLSGASCLSALPSPGSHRQLSSCSWRSRSPLPGALVLRGWIRSQYRKRRNPQTGSAIGNQLDGFVPASDRHRTLRWRRGAVVDDHPLRQAPRLACIDTGGVLRSNGWCATEASFTWNELAGFAASTRNP